MTCKRNRSSANLYAVFPTSGTPDKLRKIKLSPMTLSCAKGQATRLINRGASHAGKGGVGLVLGGVTVILSAKANGKWHDTNYAKRNGWA